MNSTSVTFEHQPRKAYRFKYLSEDRRPELEANKTNTNETVYPQVKIFDPFKRSGILKLTCVSSNKVNDNGYYVHPNKIHLLGDDGASIQEFVINYEFNQLNYDDNNEVIINFKKIWIEHVRVKCKKIKIDNAKTPLKGRTKKEKNKVKNKNHDKHSLKCKTEENVVVINFVEQNIKSCIVILDPYELGYDKKRKINFDELRLCCVVEFTDHTKMRPIVSEIIKNTEVEVVDLVYNNGKVSGGTEMCILVKNLKIKKNEEEVIVRFFDGETGWIVDESLSRNHENKALFVIVPPYQPQTIIISKRVTFFLCKKIKNETERIDPTDHTFIYTPENPQLEDDDDDDGVIETIQIGQNQTEALQNRFQQIASSVFSFSNNDNGIYENSSLASASAVEQAFNHNQQIVEIDGRRTLNDSIDAQMNQNILNNDSGTNGLFGFDQLFLMTDYLDDELKQIESQNEDQEQENLLFNEQTEGDDMMDISNCAEDTTEDPAAEIKLDNLESSVEHVESTDGYGNVESSINVTNSSENVTIVQNNKDQIDNLSSSPNTIVNVFKFFSKYLSKTS